MKLRENVFALPDSNPRKKKFWAYLKGTGEIYISLDTSKVVIVLEQFRPYYKRVVPRPFMTLGRSSVIDHPLQKSSYRLRLKKQGHHEVIYPLLISRGEVWESINVLGDEAPIHIPKKEELEEDEFFISGGWFWAGGDLENTLSLSKKRIWIDDFVIQKYPVTNQQYIEFLNDLPKQGREEEALEYAPPKNAEKIRAEGRYPLWQK